MPRADASEGVLEPLAIAIANGNLLVDAEVQHPAGDLEPFVGSGMPDRDRSTWIQVLEETAYEANCPEWTPWPKTVLTMQAAGRPVP